MHIMKRAVEDLPNVEMDIYVGDFDEAVSIVKNTQQNLYDCIISRGGTASLLRKVADIPVIQINLSVNDVLSVIKLAESYSKKIRHCGGS